MTTEVTTDVVAQVVVEDATGSVSVIETQQEIIEVVTEGPQGPSGLAGTPGIGLPTGGDPGNILMKSGTANYATAWAPVVDGGTFN